MTVARPLNDVKNREVLKPMRRVHNRRKRRAFTKSGLQAVKRQSINFFPPRSCGIGSKNRVKNAN